MESKAIDIDPGVIAEMLLREDSLPGVSNATLLISLPIQQFPDAAETDLLGKIRKAMGVASGLVQYRYFEEIQKERERMMDHLIHFLFLPAPSGVEQCIVYEDTLGQIRIEMPSLSEMLVREDLKREVWKTIRPLAIR